MEERIGARLKRLREQAGLSKSELGRRSGVSREYIYQLEASVEPTTITLRVAEKLAKGLGVSPTTFIDGDSYQPLSEKLKLDDIIQIPVYSEFPFHAGEGTCEEPADYVYQRASLAASKNIECYIVKGTCLDPVVPDGAVIMVDREREIENGDIVACQIDGKLHIARLKKIAGELWLENAHGHHKMESCEASAVVIEVTRKLK